MADFERVLQSNGNGSGLFFHTGHELKVGELVIIKASINNLPNPIFLEGWVAWRRLRPRGSRLPRGLFVALADGEQARLEGFVHFMSRSPEISVIRAYPRLPVFVQAHYLTAKGTHTALTRNVSIGGAFLKCAGPLLPVGSRTSIILNLEEQIDRGLELMSEIVRFEPLLESPAIAVRFEPGQSNLAQLARAIENIQKDLTRHTIPYIRFSEQA
ncbi:PilZ domain-containing protein [Myxococcota bacterium]